MIKNTNFNNIIVKLLFIKIKQQKNIIKFPNFTNFKIIFVLLAKIIIIYILFFIIKVEKLSFQKYFIILSISN